MAGLPTVPAKSGQVMKSPRYKYVGKWAKCWICGRFADFDASAAARMLNGKDHSDKIMWHGTQDQYL